MSKTIRPIHLRILGLPGSGKSTAAALLYACLVNQSSSTPPAVRYYMDATNLRAASSLFRQAVSTPQGTSVQGQDSYSMSFMDRAHTSEKNSGGEEGIPLRVETLNLSGNEAEAAQALWPQHETTSVSGPTLVANLWVLDSMQLLKPGDGLRVIASVLRSIPAPPKESRWGNHPNSGPANFLLLTRWDIWETMDLPIGYGKLIPPPTPTDTRARQDLLANLLVRSGANSAPTAPVLPVPVQVPLVFSGKRSTGAGADQAPVFEQFIPPYSVAEYTALLSWLARTATG
jgi:hypothetical protein